MVYAGIEVSGVLVVLFDVLSSVLVLAVFDDVPEPEPLKTVKKITKVVKKKKGE